MAFNVKRQSRVIGVYPEVEELMLKHNLHPQLVHASNLIFKCKSKKALDLSERSYRILRELLPVYIKYLEFQLSIADYSK